MGLGLYRNGRHHAITPWEGSWAAQEKERRERFKVPAPKPFSREPIPPVERHRDHKNDYQRRPKHPLREELE